MHLAHRKLPRVLKKSWHRTQAKKTHRGTKEIGSNFFQFVFVEKAENLGVANLCCSENAVLGAKVLREACRGTLGGGLPGMTAQ